MARTSHRGRTRSPLRARWLGRRHCGEVVDEMRRFTLARDDSSADEIWLCEHEPVFTLGHAGRPEHVLSAGAIPVLGVDRGGQVTYHGPGQLVAYLLLDLRRRNLGVKRLVASLEGAVLDLLTDHGVAGERRAGAPGVYVAGRKVAALGLRVRRGCCYHGLALNVDMDLAPFSGIDPCGYPGLEVVQLRDLGIPLTVRGAAERLLPRLAERLGDPAPTLPPAG